MTAGLAACLAGTALAGEPAPPAGFGELAERVCAALARVEVEGAPEGQGIGSGFFVRADGLLLTNEHVVRGARAVWVELHPSGRRAPARVLGTDPRTDLAVLQVQAPGPFAALPLGDSDRLRVGAWVLAAGHPWGLGPVVAKGILSGKGRAVGDLAQFQQGFFDFLQTDAAIERGNSGGPLVNLRGEVVGVNTATNARARGIGFAVPVNVVKAVLPHLLAHGALRRSWLGIGVEQLTWERASGLGLGETRGVLVTRVQPGSPAAAAGLRAGDVLREVQGWRVAGRPDLVWRVATWPAGKPLGLGVYRAGRELELEVIPRPRESAR
jgi:serine protease Do